MNPGTIRSGWRENELSSLNPGGKDKLADGLSAQSSIQIISIYHYLQ
ncbi:hypothetical protein HMPREF0201_01178 [Cedecea davisae DSM 4568]|uniref:Uncharacterized protein n=1 Tax=Cedecea davisae DSM 4568 TaxID=566551 RepID=S3JZY0_9ENTR|nr:hypothetical protein HMPREF0201_01178 [Cedecea davisae DSM 4568]